MTNIWINKACPQVAELNLPVESTEEGPPVWDWSLLQFPLTKVTQPFGQQLIIRRILDNGTFLGTMRLDKTKNNCASVRAISRPETKPTMRSNLLATPPGKRHRDHQAGHSEGGKKGAWVAT